MSLLCYYTVCENKLVPTFRRKAVLPSAGRRNLVQADAEAFGNPEY